MRVERHRHMNNSINNKGNKEIRDKKIDLIKGIGIILMVFRHARAPYSDFVLLFHMAIFFIASGYLFKSRNSDNLLTIGKYIKKKIKGLWIPYVGFSIIFILLNNFFLYMNVYTDNYLFLKENGSEYDSLGRYITFEETVIQIGKAIFFKANTQMGGGFWFFQTLFLVLVLYTSIDFIIKNKLKNKKMQLISQGIISILFLTSGYYFHILDLKMYGMDRVLCVYILIYIGFILKKTSIIQIVLTQVNKKFVLISAFTILLIAYQYGCISLDSGNIKNPIFFLIVSIVGWVMLYVIVEIFEDINFIGNNTISYISTHSVIIIALHFLCFKIVNWIGVIITNIDSFNIASFPVLFTDGIWWIAYTLVGITLPLLIDNIIIRVKYLIISIGCLIKSKK